MPAPRMSMTPGPGGAYAAKALFSVIATNVVVPPPVRKALRRYGVPEFRDARQMVSFLTIANSIPSALGGAVRLRLAVH